MNQREIDTKNINNYLAELSAGVGRPLTPTEALTATAAFYAGQRDRLLAVDGMLNLKRNMRAYAGNGVGIFPDRDLGDGQVEFYVMTNDDGSLSSWASPTGQRPIVASNQAELDRRVAERFPDGKVRRIYGFDYLIGQSESQE